MTKKQLEYVKTVLIRIVDTDQHVAKAIAYIDKDLKEYDARVGQLKDQYEADLSYL